MKQALLVIFPWLTARQISMVRNPPVSHLLPLHESSSRLFFNRKIQPVPKVINHPLFLQQQRHPVDGRDIVNTDYLFKNKSRKNKNSIHLHVYDWYNHVQMPSQDQDTVPCKCQVLLYALVESLFASVQCVRPMISAAVVVFWKQNISSSYPKGYKAPMKSFL